MVKAVDRSLGTDDIDSLSGAEKAYRAYSGKRLVAAQALQPGTTLSGHDIVPKKSPNEGLLPDQIEELIGREVRRPIDKDQIILMEDVR